MLPSTFAATKITTTTTRTTTVTTTTMTVAQLLKKVSGQNPSAELVKAINDLLMGINATNLELNNLELKTKEREHNGN